MFLLRLPYLIVPLVALAPMPGPAAGQSVVLQPKYAPGRTTYVEISKDIRQVVTGGPIGAGGLETAIRQHQGVMQSVESVNAGGHVKLVLKFERQAMFIDSSMQKAAYDSDSASPGPAAALLIPVFSPMIGESMTMEIDREGRVTSFTGMKDILAKVEKSAQGNLYFENLRVELDDEVQKVQWGEARMSLYPFKEVRPGDTWTREFRQSHRPARIVEYKVRLEEIGRKDGRAIARVTFTATMRPPDGAKPEPLPRGMSAEFLSGREEGEAIFDIEHGEFTQIRAAGEENSALNLPAAAGGPNPPTLKVTEKAKSTVIVMDEAQRAKQKAENRNRTPHVLPSRAATKPAPSEP